jgi:hypothetical protein
VIQIESEKKKKLQTSHLYTNRTNSSRCNFHSASFDCNYLLLNNPFFEHEIHRHIEYYTETKDPRQVLSKEKWSVYRKSTIYFRKDLLTLIRTRHRFHFAMGFRAFLKSLLCSIGVTLRPITPRRFSRCWWWS